MLMTTFVLLLLILLSPPREWKAEASEHRTHILLFFVSVNYCVQPSPYPSGQSVKMSSSTLQASYSEVQLCGLHHQSSLFILDALSLKKPKSIHMHRYKCICLLCSDHI